MTARCTTPESRWANKLNREYKSVLAQVRKTVERIVAFGTHLNQAKAEIGFGKWSEFVRKSLNVTHDAVSKYMAIARNRALADFDNHRTLPAALDTLYKLSRIPEPVLLAAIERGDVHPDMRGEDVDKLNLKPQGPLVALASGIAFVARFVDQKGLVPALSYLSLSKGQVRAYTGRSGIIWSLPGWTLDETVAVVGKDLERALNDLVAGTWRDVKIAVEDDKLIVQAGNARTVLPLLTSDVPTEIKAALAMEPPTDGVQLSPEFWAALKRVEPVVSKDATKPGLTGVYWSPEGEVIATDNFRISVCKTIPCPMEDGLLIPDSLLVLLGARLEEFKAIQVVDDNLWLMHERDAVYTELIEGRFPATGVQGAITKAHEMVESATRITILADPERFGRVVKRGDDPNSRIRVQAVDGALTVSVFDHKGGVPVEDTVPAQVVGGPVSFEVDGRKLLDALSIGLTFLYAPGQPLLFQSDDGLVEHLLSLLLTRDDATSPADEILTKAETDPAPPEPRSTLTTPLLLDSALGHMRGLGADLKLLVDRPEVQDRDSLARDLKLGTIQDRDDTLTRDLSLATTDDESWETIASMRERWARLCILFDRVFGREEVTR